MRDGMDTYEHDVSSQGQPVALERRPLTHQDELETRSDDLLYRLEDQFKGRIAGCRYEDDRHRLETDLCYIQRELDIRRHRVEFAEALRAQEEAAWKKNASVPETTSSPSDA